MSLVVGIGAFGGGVWLLVESVEGQGATRRCCAWCRWRCRWAMEPTTSRSRCSIRSTGRVADHEPLADVLADPEIEIVMHAGRQDVAILKRV